MHYETFMCTSSIIPQPTLTILLRPFGLHVPTTNLAILLRPFGLHVPTTNLTILLRPFGLHVPTTNLLSIRLTMIFQKRNTTGANGGTGTTYTSGAPVFTHVLVEFVLLNISFSVLYFVYHVCRFLSCILSTTYVVLSLFF